jgi:drug/metabolite transporter superfamily protein YnfA
MVIVFEVGGTDASPLMRLAESLGLFVAAVDSEAAFSQAFGRAFAAEGGSLIVVRS